MTTTPANTELNMNPKEQQFINAKSWLLTASNDTGTNLYDHLSSVLSKVLDERPENAADIIEDISKDVKRSKFVSRVDTVQDKVDKSTEVALAEIHQKLFSKGEGDEADQDQDEEVETPLPNLMDHFFYFEQAGIGLGREELVRIWLALKDLVDRYPLQHVHFWGKIFGTEQNYLVAEVEYREGNDEGDEEEEEEEAHAEEETEKEGDEDGEEEEQQEDDTPKPDWKPPPEVPREENRSGSNKKTYFVCNDPGKPWIKLPPVTPAQVQGARQIKKYFTGRLDAPIVSYPPFPGNESNYLRAQIARISAGTHISPLSYYIFDEEEEEEEEGGSRENFIINPDYEPHPMRDLTDPSLSHWVHHVQHILPQGRCVWFPPAKPEQDEFEDEEEEEEREEPDEPEPERGPELLTPLSEDAEVDNMPPWTPKLSYNLIPQYACAVMRSNLWPGAYAFAAEKKFENVYIGSGHKYSKDNYSPPETTPIREEFPSGAEITEIEDPSVEEERQIRKAQQDAVEPEEMEEAEEEEEEDD